MSEDLLGRILASVNTEPKNILLAFCLNNQYRHRCELRDAYQEITPTQTDVNRIQVLLRPLITMGMINAIGHKYALTPDGEIAQKIAAFSIEYTLRNQISMIQLFGPAQTTGATRGPYNRFRILETMTKTTITDLETALGGACGGISKHLYQLQDLGLVSVTSVNTETTGWGKYIWTGEKIRTRDPFLKAILEQIYQKQTTMQDLLKIIRNPNKIRRTMQKLVERGVVTHDYKSGEQQSSVQITQLGEQLREELIIPIRQYVQGQNAQVQSNWEKYQNPAFFRKECARQALHVYLEKASPQNKISMQERIEPVRKLITQQPMRPCEIAIRTGYPQSMVKDCLKRLPVTREKEGKAVYYTIIL